MPCGYYSSLCPSYHFKQHTSVSLSSLVSHQLRWDVHLLQALVFLLKLVFYAFMIKLFYQWKPQKGLLFPHVRMTFGTTGNLKIIGCMKKNVCNMDTNSILYRGWPPSQFFTHWVLEILCVNSKRKIRMKIRRPGSLLNDLRIKSTLLLADLILKQRLDTWSLMNSI